MLVENVAARLVDTLYGGPEGPPRLSQAGSACLHAASYGVKTLAVMTLKTQAKCRRKVRDGALLADPARCTEAEPKFRSRIRKAEAKLRRAVFQECSDAGVPELPYCGAASGVTTEVQAAACLIRLVHDTVDPTVVPAERSFAAPSLFEAVYPPVAVCGDGVVNLGPSAQLPLGEECDGASDVACPGRCLPPGDPFECTCGDRPRVRTVIDATASEVDSGWTGLGHDQPVADQSGFVTSLTNCDCSAVVDGECVGASTDPVCDVRGYLAPVCSWDKARSGTCDEVGNANGQDEDKDCYVCDAHSANAGARCASDQDCQSRCFNAQGVAMSPCTAQSDCAFGEVCRGRCDRTQSCVVLPNGGPLAVSAAGVAVCSMESFRTDVTGTLDLRDGGHSFSYRQWTKIHLGESTERPCPVCGGFCDGGARDLAVCKGRCAADGAPCRFDTECTAGDYCSAATPDCPGGKCVLSLVCGSTDPTITGRACRIDYVDPVFGALSNDCPPNPNLNISGQGLAVDYLPSSSGTTVLSTSYPCTRAGLELYDCPCPDGGAQPTAPNACTPACNAPGPDFGRGCADATGAGAGTTCDGGVNEGRLCDEDDDCPNAACARNPKHCSGDPAFEHTACASNADCGLGACVDACPGGRCVPLCVASASKPDEGHCAAGPPVYHCSGEGWASRSCSRSATESVCDARCDSAGTACESDSDCPYGDTCRGPCESARDCEAGIDGILGSLDDRPGAGPCIEAPRSCFLTPVSASGAAPGLSVYDSAAVWCFGATSNPGINASTGFGGPARSMVRGVNVPNFSAIPVP